LLHLIELLDGTPAIVCGASLEYRPCYTPVMRALAQQHSGTLVPLAELAGVTKLAATQILALMKKEGLVWCRHRRGWPAAPSVAERQG
jgi:hypothetical protein